MKGMKKQRVSIIAALGATNRAIGRNNDLIWKISDDLKRFKALTTGHPIIMGRKTYESIGRPLPNRTNIIVTRDRTYKKEGCVVVHSLEEALSAGAALDTDEIFIIGGGELYAQALPHTDRLYLTLVHSNESGDVFFPPYEMFTNIVEKEDHSDHTPPYTWVTLEKEIL